MAESFNSSLLIFLGFELVYSEVREYHLWHLHYTENQLFCIFIIFHAGRFLGSCISVVLESPGGWRIRGSFILEFSLCSVSTLHLLQLALFSLSDIYSSINNFRFLFLLCSLKKQNEEEPKCHSSLL